MKKTILVTQSVNVEVDESKFTQEFFDDFNRHFYNFGNDIDKHIEHLAQLFARGIAGPFSTFIEGYGEPEEMGIVFSDDDVLEIEQAT